MKRVFYIARNELSNLFFSPIAWLLMIIFLVLTASDYLAVLEGAAGNYERGGPFLMFVKNLTDAIIISSPQAYFTKIIANLYIFFPLVTMGLISREINNGTIRLLYSSPIRISEVVWGKFLAMVSFTLVFVVLVFFTLVGLSVSLARPDYAHILASVTGLFLLFAAYASIGLFISSLTSYQIVAAIITFTVFAFFSKVGELWQDIDFLRDITFYLNIGGKSTNLVRGLFNLRDVAYFLIIIMGFLLFTVIRLRSSTQSISTFRKASRYLVVITGMFVAGYITNKPSLNAYLDVTRDKLHTITPPTQAMLAKLDDGPLEITVFSNLFLDFGRFHPGQQNNIVNEVWEPYIRFKPDINIRFVYYYDVDTSSWHYDVNPGKTLKEIAEKEVKTYKLSLNRFLPPQEINKIVNVKEEEFRNFFRLTYKGKSVILRTFDDIMYWPSENEIAAAVNRLIATPPKFAFLTDEIERGPLSERTRDYKMIASQRGFRAALVNQGYDCDTVSLKTGDIPAGIATLVVADPRTEILPAGIEKINRYIAAGGNLFIAAEPDRKSVIKPIFDTLGLSLRDGLLIQPSDRFSSDVVFAHLTDTAKHLNEQFYASIQEQIKYYGDTLFRVAMGGAGVIEYKEKNGFRIYPLLVTDSVHAWNRTAPISSDSLQTKVKAIAGDEKGRFVTAVRMNRKINGGEQRIIVASDADYLTRPLIDGWDPPRHNFAFGAWCFSYFSYGQFPANTLRPQTDDALDIKVADLSIQRIILVYLLPVLIAIIASFVLIRRKRK